MTGHNRSSGADVGAVVAELYECISFPPGGRPELNRLAALFQPFARLIHVTDDKYESMDVETFCQRFRERVDNGDLKAFSESEIAQVSEIFGGLAHVFSTYETRMCGNETNVQGRGINSIQLIRDTAGWRVTSIAWFDEQPGRAIPPAYLPDSDGETR